MVRKPLYLMEVVDVFAHRLELLKATHDEAETLSTVLDRSVTYPDVSIRAFTKAAKAMGFPLFAIAQMRHYAQEMRSVRMLATPRTGPRWLGGEPGLSVDLSRRGGGPSRTGW